MKLTDKIKDKIPGLSNYYNQKALIWRNRGDSTALEIVDAIRIKYRDEPNVHELSTGETIPAVPKDYVMNMYGQGSYFCGVEASDDQIVIFKPVFNLENLEDLEDLTNSDIDLDTDLEGEDVKKRLIDKEYSAVNFSVLDNRDERFTFLSNELETADDKYGVGSLLYDNMDVVLPVVAAVAVAIVMYTMKGDIVPALENFGSQVQTMNSNLAELQNTLNQTAPPGR